MCKVLIYLMLANVRFAFINDQKVIIIYLKFTAIIFY
jgi:hypothetical protein